MAPLDGQRCPLPLKSFFFFLISSSWVNVDPSGQNFISFPSMSCRHTSPFNHGSVKLGTYIISGIMWSEFSLRETCFPIGKATQPYYHAERLSTRGQTAWRKELGHPLMAAPLEESGRTWTGLNYLGSTCLLLGKGREVSLVAVLITWTTTNVHQGLIWVLIFFRVASLILVLSKLWMKLLLQWVTVRSVTQN